MRQGVGQSISCPPPGFSSPPTMPAARGVVAFPHPCSRSASCCGVAIARNSQHHLLWVRALRPAAGLRAWQCQACSMPARQGRRAIKKRPLNRQARHPRHRASPGVEQPIARICVRLAPLPQVFRHLALCWPPRPPGIFPLHLQDSPDGLPSLSVLSLEPKGFKIREPYLIPAHH